MLYNERAECIMQQLQLRSTVKVNELSQLLEVSVDTIRRDLKQMEGSGLVICVRGGARLPESIKSMANFTGREVIHADLKREASRLAVSLVKQGDIVALNSGTTNTVLAEELLLLQEEFTVVTNNLAAANVLLQSRTIQVILVGGMLDTQECSTYGEDCLSGFSQYYPDLTFLSINAVNYQDGYTDFRLKEIPVIRLLARISKRTVAVMDSSKLGRCSKRKVLDGDKVDLLLMNGTISQEIRDQYAEAGIRINDLLAEE